MSRKIDISLIFIILLLFSSSSYAQYQINKRSDIFSSFRLGNKSIGENTHNDVALNYRMYLKDTLIDGKEFIKYRWEKFTHSDTILSLNFNYEFINPGVEYILLDSALSVVHYISLSPSLDSGVIFGERASIDIEEFKGIGYPDSSLKYSIKGKDRFIVLDKSKSIPMIFQDTSQVLVGSYSMVYTDLIEEFEKDAEDLSDVNFGLTSVGDKMQVLITIDKEKYSKDDISGITPNMFHDMFNNVEYGRLYTYEYVRDKMIDGVENAIISVSKLDLADEKITNDETSFTRDKNSDGYKRLIGIKGKPKLYLDPENEAGPVIMETSSKRNVLGLDSYVYSFHTPYYYGIKSDFYSIFPVAITYAAGEKASIIYLKIGGIEYGEKYISGELYPDKIHKIHVQDSKTIKMDFSLQKKSIVSVSIRKKVAESSQSDEEKRVNIFGPESFSRGIHSIICELDEPLVRGMEYHLSFSYDEKENIKGTIWTSFVANY